ncbi:MAG: selenide, water dikinase SelD [Nitrospirales bacterium]|nr:selenide, water dikinase SelD [Nitrospirales bacterium]
MGPSDLHDIIDGLALHDDPHILVGPGDDAGVHLLGETALVETVDVITPVVDDPFTFGAISACNSLSDVYAMGGRPLSALAIAGFPSCDYGPAVFREILKGAVSTLQKAGASLIGGHSFDDQELKFGLSVTGIAEKDRLLRVSGAKEGDLLILTKPLGVGILTTGLKAGKLREEELKEATEWMLTLNDKASELALRAGASSCTDVTGFGLLGHAQNMVRESGLDFCINAAAVPVMRGVQDMIDSGMVPAGAYNNLRFLEGKVDFSSSISEELRLILSDPQTSGGLLLSLPEEGLKVFEESALFFAVIGRVSQGEGKIFVT